MGKITTFDDWTDYFRQWQKDIGLDTSKFDDYKFEVKFGAVPTETIEFGDYSGRPKWETVLQIPDQRVRDALLHLITYQGDTEFASVEQQRNLLNTAPSQYDLQSAVKIMGARPIALLNSLRFGSLDNPLVRRNMELSFW